MNTLPRPRPCKACGQEFTPARPMQRVCGASCAYKLATEATERKRAQKARRERLEGRRRLMTRRDWLKRAQAQVNAYVRARDKGKPCISCGKPLAGKYDAGHYRHAGGNPALRLEPDNIHGQCVPCNQHLSGNLINFRIGLLTRIGPERLAWIEGPHEPKHFTIADLQAIGEGYVTRRAHHPALVKRAYELRKESMGYGAIAGRLYTEFGVVVGLSTVRDWLKHLPRSGAV